jgi:hypothetical protein
MPYRIIAYDRHHDLWVAIEQFYHFSDARGRFASATHEPRFQWYALVRLDPERVEVVESTAPTPDSRLAKDVAFVEAARGPIRV